MFTSLLHFIVPQTSFEDFRGIGQGLRVLVKSGSTMGSVVSSKEGFGGGLSL